MQQNSLDTFQTLFAHAGDVSFETLVKIYRSGCIGQHSEILVSQAQAVLLNE